MMGGGKIENWERFLLRARSNFEDKYKRKYSSFLKLSDFTLVKTIGFGAYGQVVLAKYKEDESFYAMKILEKEHILRSGQLKHVFSEKRILQAIDFEFIVKMKYFFKDNCYLYIVMYFVPGGDLFTILQKVKKFNDDSCKFYAAQVLLALEYLHYLHIVYRDLKPENLLIGIDGYIKIADLGFCKRITSRTYTLCGTPEYFAPEIVQLKGHGMAVDWWCFGVLVYEFTVGSSPFFADDQYTMLKSITEGKYDSKPLASAVTRDLVENLLRVKPTERLGNFGNGPADIKSHAWFKKTVWLDVLNKKVRPPYRPRLSGPGDSSFFENFTELPLKKSSKVLFEEEFKDF